MRLNWRPTIKAERAEVRVLTAFRAALYIRPLRGRHVDRSREAAPFAQEIPALASRAGAVQTQAFRTLCDGAARPYIRAWLGHACHGGGVAQLVRAAES